MKKIILAALLVLTAVGVFSSCDGKGGKDDATIYFVDHSITIVDTAGNPFEGVDCYLYFLTDKNETLVSTQTTDETGKVHYSKSDVGSYLVMAGYMGLAETYELGEFLLDNGLNTSQQFVFNKECFSVNKAAIDVDMSGNDSSGAKPVITVISTDAWSLDLGTGSVWLTAGTLSGVRGKYEITLTADPYDGDEERTCTVTIAMNTGSKNGKIAFRQVGEEVLPDVVYMDDDLEWLTTLYEGAGKTIGDFLNDQSKTSMAAWDTNLQHRGWERDGNRTYIGKGYFRCNTGDNTGTLKSPYLTEIGSETVNVLVQIEVAKWITSGEVGSGEITVTVSGSGTINGNRSINIVADNTAWNEFVTKEFTITGAKSDTRLLIAASHAGKSDASNPEGKNPQFMFGGIKVTLIR